MVKREKFFLTLGERRLAKKYLGKSFFPLSYRSAVMKDLRDMLYLKYERRREALANNLNIRTISPKDFLRLNPGVQDVLITRLDALLNPNNISDFRARVRDFKIATGKLGAVGVRPLDKILFQNLPFMLPHDIDVAIARRNILADAVKNGYKPGFAGGLFQNGVSDLKEWYRIKRVLVSKRSRHERFNIKDVIENVRRMKKGN